MILILQKAWAAAVAKGGVAMGILCLRACSHDNQAAATNSDMTFVLLGACWKDSKMTVEKYI